MQWKAILRRKAALRRSPAEVREQRMRTSGFSGDLGAPAISARNRGVAEPPVSAAGGARMQIPGASAGADMTPGAVPKAAGPQVAACKGEVGAGDEQLPRSNRL